jgi:hypothetical protein
MKLQELFSTDWEATPWRRQFLPLPKEYKMAHGSSWTLASAINKNADRSGVAVCRKRAGQHFGRTRMVRGPN